jgi:hypothetical protein
MSLALPLNNDIYIFYKISLALSFFFFFFLPYKRMILNKSIKKRVLSTPSLKTTHYKNGWRRPTVWGTKGSRNSKHGVRGYHKINEDKFLSTYAFSNFSPSF